MANDSKTWRCGKYELSFDRPRIMGVLNVTPDSFSDGGEHFDPDAAIEYGLAMLDAGADIIDVGGESTRPGFTPVNPDEEARRVLPVVRALAKEGAIVSIDTRHVAVAKAAVRCGASIVNDVTGFTDPKMVEFVKTSTCGVIVMHAGEVVAPAGAGLLASAGYASVKVHAAPRVGIISLGTELVAPGELPARGQIRDSNSSALMAEALDAGAEPVFYGIAPDDEQAIAELVHRAVQECDFVITSGGASAGDYDFVTALVRREGEVLFDRISMRPGKAITFGLLGGKPYLGLSGNPAAAYVGFEMLARPAIRKMRGFAEVARPVQQATLTHGVKKRQHRRFFDRATVLRDPETGELLVTEAKTQNSALLGTMQRANCLLRIDEGPCELKAGDAVDVVRVDLPEGAVL